MVDIDKNLDKEIDKNASFVSELDGSVLDPVQNQHELLVIEIESTDGHLGTALRSVYEDSEPERFLESLEGRIKGHDKQIEHMCNHHYQGFIASVHSLLRVRTDVDKLKFEIESVNGELQASGAALLNKWQVLLALRKQQENIETTMDLMTACLPVLEMYNKLKKQMENKRFYPALKTLEMLEHTYLPQVSRYTFTEEMRDSIPALRDHIKHSSMEQLRHFLESLRKHSGRIGEVTMKQTAKENGIDMENMVKNKDSPTTDTNPFNDDSTNTPNNHSVNTPNDHSNNTPNNQLPRKQSMFSIINFSDVSEDGVSAQELIDFSPVHRCLHIYSVLGDKDSFEAYYRSQRKKQCRLALQPSNPLNTSIEFFKSYSQEIVGFFVVEDHILHTSSNLLTQPHVDESWDAAQAKIIAVLRTHIGQCTESEILFQVKTLLLVFCLSLKNYGFGAAPLFDLLLEVRDQYSEILRQRWVLVFEEIFRNDNYTPIHLTSQKDYDAVTAIYPYKNLSLEREPFPKHLPFSEFVPAIYSEVKKYISACLQFSQDLQISASKKQHIGNMLLFNMLHNTLLSSIHNNINNNNLVQLIQISINMQHLDQSCVYLEHFITSISGMPEDKSSKLEGQSMFKGAKSDAESEIYKQIDLKIDEFFDLAAYDWTATEVSTEASSYISDLISFLNGIFHSFTNLSEKVAQTACMSACKHIADNMKELLRSEEVKMVTEAFLQQMRVDLKECEDFALRAPVAGIDRHTFKMAFEDLRQLLDLIITEEWASYFADYGKRNHRYQRVQPSVCILLLERLKESDKRRLNLLSSLKRNERDKKKFFDTILKQLRLLSS